LRVYDRSSIGLPPPQLQQKRWRSLPWESSYLNAIDLPHNQHPKTDRLQWSEVLQTLLMMKTFTAIIERDRDTGLYVGYIPNFPGAHSQGETLDELRENLSEVLEMLLEDKPPQSETEFVGTQQIVVQAA
jgi:predicted RNase H-like HicB family nuclease